MSEKKPAWTKPGPVDGGEAVKGTAAVNPVLVVGPDRSAAERAAGDGHAPAQTEAAEEPRDTRSPDQIEAQIDRTLEHLSQTLDELNERLTARELARRSGRTVKAQFTDEQTGQPRPERIAGAVAALGMAVGALVGLRKLRHRWRREAIYRALSSRGRGGHGWRLHARGAAAARQKTHG
jgi:hypothetical protein